MAADAFSTANEEAAQRSERGGDVQSGEGVDAAAAYREAHGTTNSTGLAPANLRRAPRPDSWIPVEEHVLHKPQRKVKMISIGCGFSGMYNRVLTPE